jgi:hypothetical protein
MAPSRSHVGRYYLCAFRLQYANCTSEKAENHYVFIGDCYAHGFMDGEAIEKLAAGKFSVTEFRVH